MQSLYPLASAGTPSSIAGTFTNRFGDAQIARTVSDVRCQKVRSCWTAAKWNTNSAALTAKVSRFGNPAVAKATSRQNQIDGKYSSRPPDRSAAPPSKWSGGKMDTPNPNNIHRT